MKGYGKPKVVVSGHAAVGVVTGPDSPTFIRNYLRAYEANVAGPAPQEPFPDFRYRLSQTNTIMVKPLHGEDQALA